MTTSWKMRMLYLFCIVHAYCFSHIQGPYLAQWSHFTVLFQCISMVSSDWPKTTYLKGFILAVLLTKESDLQICFFRAPSGRVSAVSRTRCDQVLNDNVDSHTLQEWQLCSEIQSCATSLPHHQRKPHPAVVGLCRRIKTNCNYRGRL